MVKILRRENNFGYQEALSTLFLLPLVREGVDAINSTIILCMSGKVGNPLYKILNVRERENKVTISLILY